MASKKLHDTNGDPLRDKEGGIKLYRMICAIPHPTLGNVHRAVYQIRVANPKAVRIADKLFYRRSAIMNDVDSCREALREGVRRKIRNREALEGATPRDTEHQLAITGLAASLDDDDPSVELGSSGIIYSVTDKPGPFADILRAHKEAKIMATKATVKNQKTPPKAARAGKAARPKAEVHEMPSGKNIRKGTLAATFYEVMKRHTAGITVPDLCDKIRADVPDAPEPTIRMHLSIFGRDRGMVIERDMATKKYTLRDCKRNEAPGLVRVGEAPAKPKPKKAAKKAKKSKAKTAKKKAGKKATKTSKKKKKTAKK